MTPRRTIRCFPGPLVPCCLCPLSNYAVNTLPTTLHPVLLLFLLWVPGLPTTSTSQPGALALPLGDCVDSE